jgi:MurNAc alpha-1-phosphate uridylyltransferase
VNIADVPVAILAGGKATRLGPLSADLPKALVPLAGRPFLDYQLELLHDRGVRRVVLCLGHLGDRIVAHVGDGARYGLQVQHVFDGPRLLGTGGALLSAAPLLGPLWWVLYGDSYLDFDYAAVLEHFLARSEPALMTVHRNAGRWDRSNAVVRDGKVTRYDKRRPTPDMAYIDYGASLFRAPVLERIPADEPYDLADLCHGLSLDGQLAVYEVPQRFYEIGSTRGIRETEQFLIVSGRATGTDEGRKTKDEEGADSSSVLRPSSVPGPSRVPNPSPTQRS